MTDLGLSQLLKVITSVSLIFMFAAAVLWTVIQHSAFLSSQAATQEALSAQMQSQAAALTALAQIHDDRMQMNRDALRIMRLLERELLGERNPATPPDEL